MTRTKHEFTRLFAFLMAVALAGCATAGGKLVLTAEYTAVPWTAAAPPTSTPSPGE